MLPLIVFHNHPSQAPPIAELAPRVAVEMYQSDRARSRARAATGDHRGGGGYRLLAVIG